jgi:ABC-2 type transport system permease protein
LVNAERGLMAGNGVSGDILWVLGWGAAFIVIFGTLTMRLYNRN